MQSVVKRATHFEHHQIRREQIPTRVRMAEILPCSRWARPCAWIGCCAPKRGAWGIGDVSGAAGAVQEQLIWILQAEPLGPIHFALAGQHEESVRGAAH